MGKGTQGKQMGKYLLLVPSEVRQPHWSSLLKFALKKLQEVLVT